MSIRVRVRVGDIDFPAQSCWGRKIVAMKEFLQPDYILPWHLHRVCILILGQENVNGPAPSPAVSEIRSEQRSA
jgi:hypothetical protein